MAVEKELSVSGGSSKKISGIFAINAKYIAVAHALTAYSAFISALVVGCYLHYEKIVENSSFGYPDEWFPSVSAAIGDRYPERSIFQILIAVTSGPRFLLLIFNFIKSLPFGKKKAVAALFLGVLRTFTCGGWVYITSTDDHDWHDIFMIAYIALTIPWTVLITVCTESGSTLKWGRRLTGSLFFLTLVPLIYWFIQHKVHVIPGAYLIYAYFEWALILLDVAFDTWSFIDFKNLDIVVTSNGFSLEPVPVPVEVAVAAADAVPVKVSTKVVVATPSETALDDYSGVEFLINTINSYMFWTILTSLLLCVWYFPLWYMGISGMEVVITVIFIAPLFLTIPPLRRFFIRFPFLARAISVFGGIGAYKVEDPEQRLFTITVGTFFAVIALVSEIHSVQHNSKKYESYSISFIVGLLTTSVLKFLCYSNNPIWPVMHSENGGYNAVGLFIGLAAALLTPRQSSLISNKIVAPSGGSLILAAIGFGGYFFSIISYLSDSSTLALWSWEGFPVRGPTPVSGALFNIGSIIIGVIISSTVSPAIISLSIYNLIGGLSAVVLYKYSHWTGFAGSCVYSVYLASLSPIIWKSISGYNPGLLFSLAFFFEILISLASIWIVAYAFVPAGWALRERTDIVLGSSYWMIVIGVLNYNWKQASIPITIATTRTFKQVITILTILLSLSIAITFKRTPTKPFESYNAGSESFTAGIWCVHFGLDNDMWSSETRMRDLIHDAQVDIIGLLELDTQRLIGGNRDFTQTIAEDLGMYVDYGPGPNKHTWGAALLSKFPIINSTHHLLPSPVGELAPAIHATLDIYGELIDVVVFHSGQEEDIEDRRLQSLGIQEIMGSLDRPLVLLSYLVTEPLQGNYNTYVSEKSRMYDIDNTDWDRWCEYILFRELRKVGYARISRSTITDTELQIAKFKLLQDDDATEEELYGNDFVDENEIEEDLRFPQMFRGDGVRGHFYHVFDEPRYFRQQRKEREE